MGAIPTIFLYLSSILLTVGLLYIANKLLPTGSVRFKALTVVSFLPIPILAMLRFNVGTDYAAYVSIVGHLGTMNVREYILDGFKGLEPASYIFSQVSMFLSGDAKVFFFLFSLVTISALYLAIQKLGLRQPLLVYTALLLVFVPLSFNGVRQMAAAAILFYATSTLINGGTYRKFALLSLVAMLFHISAAIGALIGGLYWLIEKVDKSDSVRVQIKIWLVLLMSALAFTIAFISFGQYIPLLDKFVSNSQTTELASNRMAYVFVFIFVIAAAFYRKVVATHPLAQHIYPLATIALSFVLIGFLSEYIKRFSLYFMPYIFILIYYTLEEKLKSINHRLAMVMFLTIGLVYFIGVYFVLGHGDVDNYSIAPHANNHTEP